MPWPGGRLRISAASAPAVQVVALEFGVAERHHQRQEAVDAHEPRQRVPECLLVVLVETFESVDRGLQRSVDLRVVSAAEHQSGGPLRLTGVEHAEVVEATAGVEQQVRVGGRCDGLAVVHGERLADRVGVVDEVQHEGAGLVGGGCG